ncbi:MAG: bifunctional 4-hydroxy-3-methylbut-2-enyl diphosphate reductase/30S ribosomal protein S1 [Thermacetogeniaceae bacterium]
MRIIRATSAGFCLGVRRALKLIEKALKSHERVFTLGPLIHNPAVVEDLRRKGVEIIEELSEVKGGEPVLIRTHGVAPEVIEEAKKRGVCLIDATCPFVKRVQQLASALGQQGYFVVVFGEAEHPEVKGIVGWAGNNVVVVENLADAEKLESCNKLGLVAQTTQSQREYYEVSKAIIGKAKEIRIFDTICRTSMIRQKEAAEIARRVDLMIVVGGKNSANTRQLAEICREFVPTYHIEDVSELAPGMFQGAGSIGVTAGASTPDWIIEEVIEEMMKFGEETEKLLEHYACSDDHDRCSGENCPDVTTSEGDTAIIAGKLPEPAQEEMMSLELAGTPRQIKQGDLITGTVVQIREDEVLLDIGGKSEGIIPRQELSFKAIRDPREAVSVGDVIDAYVLRVDNEEGHLILSKKRADRIKALDRLERALETKEELRGEAVKVVKGGLLVDVLNVRGFVPASLIERGRAGNLEKYIGKPLRLRVIDFDRSRGKVVLSQKAILQEEYLRAQEELWSTIQPGDTRKGIVRHLTDFGAFVDLGGVDGLLHISELSWGRVKHPSEVVHEGDEIEVYVLSVDRENKRISLSLKQLQPNPWDSVDERFQVGQIVSGSVVRLVSFGAFVEIEPGVEGLVHISRLADHRVDKPEDVVAVGQKVKVKILDINKKEHRISLSIRDAKDEVEEEKRIQATAPVGTNLGDVLGELLSGEQE